MNPPVSIWKDGRPPTSLGPDLSQEQGVLAKALGFSLSELESNRRGKLAREQRGRLVRFMLAPMHQGMSRVCTMIALLAIIGALLAVASGLPFERALDSRFLGVLFIFIAVGMARSLARAPKVVKDLVAAEVHQVQGRAFVTQRDEHALAAVTDGVQRRGEHGVVGFESKTQLARQNPHRRYYLEVGGEEFLIPEALHAAISDESQHITVVRAYYVPNSGQLMALEPLVQPPPFKGRPPSVRLFGNR